MNRGKEEKTREKEKVKARTCEGIFGGAAVVEVLCDKTS
jgi:hypothetical protein